MRAAYVRDKTLVSANETRATAQPPMATGTKSPTEIQGMENEGKPLGSDPSTETFARSAKSKK
jgi:hypothetical protein